jgi:hypothetical protein
MGELYFIKLPYPNTYKNTKISPQSFQKPVLTHKKVPPKRDFKILYIDYLLNFKLHSLRNVDTQQMHSLIDYFGCGR